MSDVPVEKVLLDLEEKFWRALASRDASTAVELTDFPCIVTGAQGVGSLDRAAFAKMLQNPSYRIERFELSDNHHVRMLRHDVAVVAYQVREALTVEGKPVSLEAADTSTWVRHDDGWRCAAHTEALAGDPFGRDRVRAPQTSAEDNNEKNDKKPATTPDSDERAIRALVAAWIEASKKKDLSKVLGLMADDALFLSPGAEPFGKKEFAEAARGMSDVEMEADSRIEEVVVAGDWAFCRTHLTVTTTAPGKKPVERSGHTLSILRKRPDGSWVIARDANLLAQASPARVPAKAPRRAVSGSRAKKKPVRR